MNPKELIIQTGQRRDTYGFSMPPPSRASGLTNELLTMRSAMTTKRA
jgi:hypothetical protein